MADLDADDELPDRDRGHYHRAVNDGPWAFDPNTGEDLDPSPLTVPALAPYDAGHRA